MNKGRGLILAVSGCAMLSLATGCVDQKRFDTAQRERDEYRAQLEAAVAELDGTNLRAQETQASLDAVSAELAAARQELSTAQANLTMTEQANQQSQQQLASLNERIAALETEVRTLA